MILWDFMGFAEGIFDDFPSANLLAMEDHTV